MAERDASPLVSVGIPTYNRAEGLVRAVASVQRQNYPRLEILISDNASTDATQEVCQKLAEGDDRIRYFRQPKNLGPIPNFAFLLENGAGTFFMWVADDDTIEPDIVPRYVRFLEQHADHVLVSGTIRYWDQGSVFKTESGFTFEQDAAPERIADFFGKVMAGGIFHGLLRREVALDVGLKSLIGSDWCFISGLLVQGKIKQLGFPAYNKSLIGLSLNLEQYAARVGASRLGRCHPRLALAWHGASQLLIDKKAYRSLPFFCRLRLSVCAYLSLAWRLYWQLLFTEPRLFFRLSSRAVVKAVVPQPFLVFLRNSLNRLRPPALDPGSEKGS